MHHAVPTCTDHSLSSRGSNSRASLCTLIITLVHSRSLGGEGRAVAYRDVHALVWRDEQAQLVLRRKRVALKRARHGVTGRQRERHGGRGDGRGK